MRPWADCQLALGTELTVDPRCRSNGTRVVVTSNLEQQLVILWSTNRSILPTEGQRQA